MNKVQFNLLNTAHAVSTEFETLTATSISPALQAAITALVNLMNQIKQIADVQAIPLKPGTRERNRRFEAAAEKAHLVAQLVLGYALGRNDDTLAGQVDFSASDFRHGRLPRRLQAMRQVHAAAQQHAVALAAFDVTPDLVTDLSAKIAAAEAMIATPRSRIAARRAATENLKQAFAQLERLFENTLDPLMKAHGQTDPNAYTRYLTARRVIDLPGTPAPAPAAASNNKPTPAVAASSESQPLAA